LTVVIIVGDPTTLSMRRRLQCTDVNNIKQGSINQSTWDF